MNDVKLLVVALVTLLPFLKKKHKQFVALLAALVVVALMLAKLLDN